MQKHYLSVSDFYKEKFGLKIYKLSLDAGCTCPTRDGFKGFGGCIFCSQAGSGDFASSRELSIKEQIENAKNLVDRKLHGKSGNAQGKYIAYFQNFTNTYGDSSRLEKLFNEAISYPDIVGIDIATRPDCLSDDILAVIGKLAEKTFVTIELGLQTIHERTIKYIRRRYETSEYDNAIKKLSSLNKNIHIVTHLIFGLPGETESEMLQSVSYVAHSGCNGIKLTCLHVLEQTDLANDYKANKFRCLEEEEYFNLIGKAIELLSPEMVVHRLTGDGPKKILIAPLWTANKRQVQNQLRAYLEKHNIIQGRLFEASHS
ncbi:MAG: TIGR01212 family radical SAM protein [Treponema sp.]|nr:TIGR01212 family radical SAM protein [Treponema sp.]